MICERRGDYDIIAGSDLVLGLPDTMREERRTLFMGSRLRVCEKSTVY